MQFSPLLNACTFVHSLWQGQSAGKTQSSLSLKTRYQGRPHRHISVRRFNEQLGLTCLESPLFQLFDFAQAILRLLRQVAYKCKILTIQAAAGQGQ